jgi:hypothetical protein
MEHGLESTIIGNTRALAVTTGRVELWNSEGIFPKNVMWVMGVRILRVLVERKLSLKCAAERHTSLVRFQPHGRRNGQ